MDYAIILGGGKGLRMGSDVPKQFIEIGGLPILMRTILRFREYGDVKIILVLPRISSIIGNISVRCIISPRTTK